MTNLKMLAKAISRCRTHGDLRGSGYPSHLKKKILLAVREYGMVNVVKTIGVGRSVISRWSPEKKSPEQFTRKSPKKKERPIVFQELPAKQEVLPKVRSSQEGTFLRLTSPTGFTISLGDNPGTEVIANIIQAFMGGQI